MNTRYSVRGLIYGGAIAALYVALTFVSAQLGLSSGVIQLRLSEALCILPIFTPAAIPGLAIGCLLANAMTGCIVLDVILGSVATLIGAVGT
ncbi:MAG: QueT transporter family protein, partial [Clostridia bacterium]|nr:QueT transporter family protein [Clostridia bacterium]